MSQEPFMLCLSGTAYSVDGIPESGPPLLPLEQLSEFEWIDLKPHIHVNKVYFGVRIPFIPNTSTSPDSVARSDHERAQEVLELQTQLVRGLAKWKTAAFSLRYIWNPALGQTDIALICRVLTLSDNAQTVGRRVAKDVQSLLDMIHIPHESVSDEMGLRSLLHPIPSQSFLAEVRQKEVEEMLVAGPAYVVHPFSLPNTTWLSLFQLVANQDQTCIINIHLQPTNIYPFEKLLFSEAAQIAASHTEIDLDQHYLQRKGTIVDPVARIVARLYTDYVQRLADPFLLTIQVGSPDPVIASNIALALASEVTERKTLEQGEISATGIPYNSEVILPQDQDDLFSAYQTLTALELHPWGGIEPTPGKDRLRYLVDAKAATCAFRFPVPVRGGIPGIPTRQSVPDFQVGRIVKEVAEGEILIGNSSNENSLITCPISTFGRHALIAGFTGSGKTTTCMHLLAQLWERGIPFLVIEPRNTQYRSLLRGRFGADVQVFTLGDESVSPFRFNPLGLLPFVRVEAHISALKACLEAALPTFALLPMLIEESLHNIYLNNGWSLSDRCGPYDSREMPTLGQLYAEIIRVADAKGHSDKTIQDIRAAAAARIASLLRGSKGRMLNTRESIPMTDLMSKPTILELDSLNADDRSLMMLFLLTAVREHCRTTRSDESLQHVTLLEEAHQVLGVVNHNSDREVSADSRAHAVQMFCDALSEVRTFGEGLLVAEQIPTRLGQDAIKNTNLKIVHQLPGEDDRQIVGMAMNMTQEQRDYVSILAPGQAAVFSEGTERPSFVSIPNYRAKSRLPPRVSEADVEEHMTRYQTEHRYRKLPFRGCRACAQQCQHRDRITNVAYEIRAVPKFAKSLVGFQYHFDRGEIDEAWRQLVAECRAAVGYSNPHAMFCYFVHLWDGEVSDGTARQFMKIAATG